MHVIFLVIKFVLTNAIITIMSKTNSKESKIDFRIHSKDKEDFDNKLRELRKNRTSFFMLCIKNCREIIKMFG